MREEISAGGVVLFGNAILLLRKFNGEIHYTFKENWDENRSVHKTVFWYLMQSKNMDTIPQKEEGFVDAKFIHIDRVVDLARYDDEKEIIKVALKEIKKRLKKS